MKFVKLSAIVAAFSVALNQVAKAAQINTNGRLEISSDDYTFSARVTGRFHMDGNFYRSGSDERRLTSGTFIRRARIGVRGNFREWEYKVEFDNATNQSNLRGAYLRRVAGRGKLTIGQFKVFESLGQVTSSNETVFIERPYVSVTTPGNQIGVGYYSTLGPLGFSANLYNLRTASDGEARPINNGVGMTGRAYMAPVNQKTLALHIGGSYGHESTDTDGKEVRVSPLGRAEKYRNEEEFRFYLANRVDEHAQVDRVIAETAAINGPLSVEAEYLQGKVHTRNRADDDFNAWYVQLSYMLTGESREYSFRRGRIERPDPSRAFGAFELAARHQRAEREKVANAKLTATEFGVTYYANQNVRFMVNYGWSENKLLDDKPHLLSTRAQFDF